MRICRLRWSVLGAVLLFFCPAVWAQKSKDKAGYDRAALSTVLHEAIVFVAADADSQRVSLVTPGHEVVIVERSAPWVKVFANTDAQQEDVEDKPEFGDEAAPQPVSGWIRDKGVVGPQTPGGDAILYGAAANLEDAATQPNAPKNAAMAAHLLYRRVAEYFPQSSLAQEAAWRSADIRWQLNKRDISTLPSAKEQDPILRPKIFEGEMKRIIKNYPGSKYAAMAAYKLLDNKLCGDWQGLPKCPAMEAGLYEKYAQQYPDGPVSAEALYNATYREAVVATMYTVEENKKKADAASTRAQSLAQDLKAKYPQSDYAARAASVAYKVQQGIAIYGNDRD
jgi:hypothetical protein